ncbi:hypothetical protein [Endozoicomonas euniceicola]|uniref:IclR-ED domain-containing protein n=1 Tax=Endozoicomonas euniceicola TaxID=1234143 RepID=A0ABY6GMV1_9GAMM|nr:hypothetical protein [Endozoicomonas euniceicola]UYM14050.1 hypothetical protein NX720_14135 [Endozoicomonas euniceicola]
MKIIHQISIESPDIDDCALAVFLPLEADDPKMMEKVKAVQNLLLELSRNIQTEINE